MAQIINIAATTETEAVNAMLAAIGEAPVADAGASTQPDVQMALGILKESLRETLTEGWKFNTRTNVTQRRAGTVIIDGTSFNVFLIPADLLRFEAGATIGSYPADIVLEMTADETNTGDTLIPLDTASVFYDHANDRPYFTQETLTLTRGVYFQDWRFLPETARQFVLKMAVNRFTESVPGSPTLVSFTEMDIMRARRSFIRDQGLGRRFNVFRATDTSDFLGGRL
jgi:hypothetical protein